MFDGMGGANGTRPEHLMRLTPGQLRQWWLAPQEAMGRGIQAAGERSAAAPAPPPTPAAMTFDQFKATFGGHPQFRDRPDDWWRAKHAEWNAEVGNG